MFAISGENLTLRVRELAFKSMLRQVSETSIPRLATELDNICVLCFGFLFFPHDLRSLR